METIGKEEGGEESWRRGKEGDEELEISDLIETEGPVFRWKGRNPVETVETLDKRGEMREKIE